MQFISFWHSGFESTCNTTKQPSISYYAMALAKLQSNLPYKTLYLKLFSFSVWHGCDVWLLPDYDIPYNFMILISITIFSVWYGCDVRPANNLPTLRHPHQATPHTSGPTTLSGVSSDHKINSRSDARFRTPP